MQGDKTMRYKGAVARIASECRFVSPSHHSDFNLTKDIEVPEGRLAAKWMNEVCDRIGQNKFKVVTQRRIYWSPVAVMCTCSATWEKTQFIVRGVAGVCVSHANVRVFDGAGY